eukprot:scaffold15198_cov28-Tisochrysis_lutea.AAC.1
MPAESALAPPDLTSDDWISGLMDGAGVPLSSCSSVARKARKLASLSIVPIRRSSRGLWRFVTLAGTRCDRAHSTINRLSLCSQSR